jgi:hypothetical protein
MTLKSFVSTQPHGYITELSRLTGITYQSLLAIINGKAKPRFVTVKAIEAATGLSSEEIMQEWNMNNNTHEAQEEANVRD